MLLNVTGALRRTAISPTIFGYQPMPKQIKFHSSQAKGRAFMGGNRSGKTVGGACELVMWLTGNHTYRNVPPPPVRMRAITVDFLEGVDKIILPEIAKWIPPSYLINQSWEQSYNKMNHTLTLENGSFVELMSYEQQLDKFAGTSRHGIWFDEEPPKAIFNENMARLIDTGGDWWLTMTPVEGMTWVYDDIYLAARTNPHFFVVEVGMDENVHLNLMEIEALQSTWSEEERKARRTGQFVAMGGLVYKAFDPSIHIVNDIVHNPEQWVHLKKWQHYLGMDAGINNPTCFLFAAISPDDRLVIYDEYYESGRTVGQNAAAILDKIRLLQIEPGWIVGDPSIKNRDPITATSVHLEYVKSGLPIVLGNNEVKAGISAIISLLENKQLFITSNCENLLREMARYRWAKYASAKIAQNKNPREEPVKKDDHAVDALRYLVAQVPQFFQQGVSRVDNILKASEATDPEAPYLDTSINMERIPVSEYTMTDTYLGGEY
jgi:phage terminase large subunit-like protein